MKKLLIIVFMGVLISLFYNGSIKASFDFDTEQSTAYGGTYQVTERTNYDLIDYGIRYTRDIAQSSSANQINGKGLIDPQVVNVLEVPSTKMLKVVNWTYSTSSAWSKQTIRSLAKDYERNNPGWVVVAGINGDFFDINGKMDLPYQTNGAAVCEGEVYRSIGSSSQVGFKNDGSTTPFVGGKNFEVTDYHELTIYNEDGSTSTYKVDKFNQEPVDNEIAVYFSYQKKEDSVFNVYKVTTPANAYLIEAPERCYPMSTTRLYAKGEISKANASKELYMGQFAIVTNNEDVQKHLEIGNTVRIQQNVIGDYADCTSITGAGQQLVYDGVASKALDGMSDYRHPRTVIGVKSDGTLVLATIDGRQESKDMYGMTYEELSAMMLYYDCAEAYNLDGGGSTTMIIRNNNGDFDVKNSPSDGEERSDSNAILIVAPELSLNIKSVTDTEATFTCNSKVEGMTFSNIKVNAIANGKECTTELAGNEAAFSNLTPETEYTANCEYDLTYLGKTIHNKSKDYTFTTGKQRPTMLQCYYEETSNYYIITYRINDPKQTITMLSIEYGDKVEFLNTSSTTFAIKKNNETYKDFCLVIDYNLDAIPSKSMTEKVTVGVKPAEEPPQEEETEKPERKSCTKCSSVAVEIISIISLFGLASYVFKRK